LFTNIGLSVSGPDETNVTEVKARPKNDSEMNDAITSEVANAFKDHNSLYVENMLATTLSYCDTNFPGIKIRYSTRYLTPVYSPVPPLFLLSFKYKE
jgi:hypothetical protein